MVRNAIKVAWHCSGCGKYFAEGFEFPEVYYCEEDSEYWAKDEGRGCPTCHKFGRNPEEPVCEGCSAEVDPVAQSVDPDKEDVMGADGNEVVTAKKQRARKLSDKGRAAEAAEREARYKKIKAAFDSGIKRYRLPDVKSAFSGDAVVAIRKMKAVDSTISVYATASVASSYHFDGTGLPYEVTFSILSEGYVGRHNSNGGFCYRAGDGRDFGSLEELVEYARKRIGETAWLA